MTVLTGEQIGVLIYDNKKWGPGGGKDAVIKFLDTAIAVALAESGGNTNAKNPNSSASGLFQIMVSVHQDKIAGRNIFDPRVNVDVARLVWEAAGKSFSPWETYTNGAYKAHLGHGKTVYDKLYAASKSGDHSFIDNALTTIISPAAGIAGIVAPGNPVTSAANKVSSLVAGALSDVMKWLAKGFIAIGAFTFALLLIGLGVWWLVKDTETGQQITAKTKEAALMAATKGAV